VWYQAWERWVSADWEGGLWEEGGRQKNVSAVPMKRKYIEEVMNLHLAVGKVSPNHWIEGGRWVDGRIAWGEIASNGTRKPK